MHTAENALPIGNTNVIIKDVYGRILYNLITDSSSSAQGLVDVNYIPPNALH